ncbi:recombination protein NinG [Serratia sp. UGAL515B_01]|uniref:recombination protein NinG n=1 Tax=Serratia sp. UGAL515B_01 TaxID=2986763 RepID=UPI002954B2F4|nr:recombination protein NinG [Serratia sp. UGAL515B_01]WON77563.1 recombination protein NinG [Serratia sp. UGAL515B_01]
MAKGKTPKPKKCRICPKKFTPVNSLQIVCCPSCAIQYAKQQSERKQKQSEADSRRLWNKRKAALKPLKHWEDMTQRVVNDYIRERDRDLPCISCGTWVTVQWEAGHYRSRGAASHLRYNEDNIHKQCHHCNDNLSSNAIPYRAALVEKIGLERVLALENNNTPHRYTREELDALRAEYRAKTRALKKQQEAA